MSDNGPLRESDIIFPSAHTSIHTTVTQLRRHNLSIKNRLTSIAKDAQFVKRIQEHFALPLIANERCGSWYISPDDKAGSAYFKSTDGHFGEWSFSLRRLNLHLLEIIEDNAGCIIIDSTRRGKSMPDALSKTIPIWIAVLNQIIFPEHSTELLLPMDVISESEHAQISVRVGQFVVQAFALKLDVTGLRQKLNRPMRPYWVTPDTSVGHLDIDGAAHPVILCTASGQASTRQTDEPDYVQGAADDHESWAGGLDPVVFWREKETLLRADEDELPSVIQDLLLTKDSSRTSRQPSLIAPTKQVFITNQDSTGSQTHTSDIVIHCSTALDQDLQRVVTSKGGLYVHLVCMDGKIGARQLRHELTKLDNLDRSLAEGRRVLCVCPSGRDLAVGVALAMICRYFLDDGERRVFPHTSNKEEIRRRLSWIMVSMPDATPSRATLQSVNAYLMS